MRVRLQARSALLQYHWAGYRSGTKTEVPPLNPTREPAPAGSEKFPPAITTSDRPPATGSRLFPSPYRNRPVPVVTPPKVTTKEPPLAPPLATPEPVCPRRPPERATRPDEHPSRSPAVPAAARDLELGPRLP